MIVKAVMLNEECKLFDDEVIDDMISTALTTYEKNLNRELARIEKNRLNAGIY
jgi:hypothetical protein